MTSEDSRHRLGPRLPAIRDRSESVDGDRAPRCDGGVRYNGSMAIRYWLGVVQHDHVLRGVAGGFAQVNHGARAPLERMGPADGFGVRSTETA